MFMKNSEFYACYIMCGRYLFTNRSISLKFLFTISKLSGPKKEARAVDGRPSYIISNHLTANSSATLTS